MKRTKLLSLLLAMVLLLGSVPVSAATPVTDPGVTIESSAIDDKVVFEDFSSILKEARDNGLLLKRKPRRASFFRSFPVDGTYSLRLWNITWDYPGEVPAGITAKVYFSEDVAALMEENEITPDSLGKYKEYVVPGHVIAEATTTKGQKELQLPAKSEFKESEDEAYDKLLDVMDIPGATLLILQGLDSDKYNATMKINFGGDGDPGNLNLLLTVWQIPNTKISLSWDTQNSDVVRPETFLLKYSDSKGNKAGETLKNTDYDFGYRRDQYSASNPGEKGTIELADLPLVPQKGTKPTVTLSGDLGGNTDFVIFHSYDLFDGGTAVISDAPKREEELAGKKENNPLYDNATETSKKAFDDGLKELTDALEALKENPEVSNTAETLAKLKGKVQKAQRAYDNLTSKYGDIIKANGSGADENAPTEAPSGYVTLIYKVAETDREKANIATTETTKYFVKKGLTGGGNDDIKAPVVTVTNENFIANDWDKDLPAAFTDDVTLTASIVPKGSIVPVNDPENPNGDKPTEGNFVLVTFVNGKTEAGSFNPEDKTMFWVNAEADPKITLSNLTRPGGTVNTGYTFNGWSDTEDGTPISYDGMSSYEITEETTFYAKYTALDSVISGDDPKAVKPNGYLTVEYKVKEGDEGKGVILTPKKWYVKPDTTVTGATDIKVPAVDPAVGYAFNQWEGSLPAEKFTEDVTIKGTFRDLDTVIKVIDDTSAEAPKGYVKVKFLVDSAKSDTPGVTYYVNPNKDVPLNDGALVAPEVKGKGDYKFLEWDTVLDETLVKTDKTITAKFVNTDAANFTPVVETILKDDKDNLNVTPEEAKKAITNLPSEVTVDKITVKTQPNPKDENPKATVIVTFPDGSDKEIDIPVKPNQAAVIDPKVPEKTPVADSDNLTEEEREKIKTAIEEKNPDFPEGITVDVDEKGKATITYPDKSEDTIDSRDLVIQKTKAPRATAKNTAEEGETPGKTVVTIKPQEGTDFSPGDKVKVTYPNPYGEDPETMEKEHVLTPEDIANLKDGAFDFDLGNEIPEDTELSVTLQKSNEGESEKVTTKVITDKTKALEEKNNTPVLLRKTNQEDVNKLTGKEKDVAQGYKNLEDILKKTGPKANQKEIDEKTKALKDAISKLDPTPEPEVKVTNYGATDEEGTNGETVVNIKPGEGKEFALGDKIRITYKVVEDGKPVTKEKVITADDSFNEDGSIDYHLDNKIPKGTEISVTHENGSGKESTPVKGMVDPDTKEGEKAKDRTPENLKDLDQSAIDAITDPKEKDVAQAYKDLTEVLNKEKPTQEEIDQKTAALKKALNELPTREKPTVDPVEPDSVNKDVVIKNIDPNGDTIEVKVGDEVLLTLKKGKDGWEAEPQVPGFTVTDNKDGSVNITPTTETAKDKLEDKEIVATVKNGRAGEPDPGKSSDPVNYNGKLTEGEKNPLKDPEKTKVDDPNNVTSEEQAKIKEAVKKANQDVTDEMIAVDDKGKVTVTYSDGSKNTLEPSETIEGKKDNEKYPLKELSPKIVVNKSDNLTDSEKAAIKGRVKEQLKDSGVKDEDIVVGNDGSVTVTYPDGTENNLTPAQTIIETGQSVAPKSAEASNVTGSTVVTMKPSEGQTFKVGDKVNVSIPGSPGETIKKEVTAEMLKDGNIVVDLGKKVAADTTLTITFEEKTILPGEVEKYKNPSMAITATVPKTDGEKYPLGELDPKVQVADPTNLTAEEKQVVKDAIKEQIPGANLGDENIDVGNDGRVTVTYKDGSGPATLTGEQTVEKKTEPTPDPSAEPTDVKQDGDKITGKGVPGATVELLKEDGTSYGSPVIVNNDGNFELPLPDGAKDGEKVKVAQTERDKAPTNSSVVTLDRVPPTVTVPKTVEGQKGQRIAPVTVTVEGAKTVEVSGLPDGLKYEDGKITGTLKESGDFIVTVKAGDDAGNVTEKEITFTITDESGHIFDPTKITGIEVKADPKLDYTEGDSLDPSPMIVTLTDANGLSKDVPHGEFGTYGITLSPSGTLGPEDSGKKVTVAMKDMNGEDITAESSGPLTVKTKVSPPSTDKSRLEDAIYRGLEVQDRDKYKHADPHKKAAFDQAMERAKEVLDDPNATQGEIDKAKDDLNAARADLNGKTPVTPYIPGGFGSSGSVNYGKYTRPEAQKVEDKGEEKKDKEDLSQYGTLRKVIKYVNGYKDGTFRPNGDITRAEAAAMFTRLLTEDRIPEGTAGFPDTVKDSWYDNPIAYLVKRGFMKGYLDGNFRPNDRITRGEFAQMIVPYLPDNDSVAPFEDVKGHWAEEAINKAFGDGILKGYEDGTFRPDREITRAEAVTIFNRVFNRSATAKNISTLINPKDLITFTDIENHWAYYDILEGANTRLETVESHNWIKRVENTKGKD